MSSAPDLCIDSGAGSAGSKKGGSLLKQGYVTLALGDRKYYEMALHLALSLKWKDPSRPVCLIHDNSQSLERYGEIFDDLVVMPKLSGYVGCANKLRLEQFSPYEETFYIDSDCLVVKPDMDRHWQKFAGADFNIAGDMATAGTWYDFDIAEACRELHLPYMVRMNSGVIFFRKTKAAERIFKSARSLVSTVGSVIGYDHQGRSGQLADEPFFGAAMGQHAITPVAYTPEEGSVMITTWQAKDCQARLEEDYASIKKASGYHLLNRFFVKSWVEHSPSIMHFIGLKPADLYQQLTEQLRRKYNIA